MQNLANPWEFKYALSGLYHVTNTYILRSNFFPPTKNGFYIYLEITKFYFKDIDWKGIFEVVDHFLSWLSLLTKKIPLPCDFPDGFIIHSIFGFLLNSYENIE